MTSPTSGSASAQTVEHLAAPDAQIDHVERLHETHRVVTQVFEQRPAQRVVDARHVDHELVDEVGHRLVARRRRRAGRRAELQQRGDAFADQRDERRVGVTFDDAFDDGELEVSRINGHAAMLPRRPDCPFWLSNVGT